MTLLRMDIDDDGSEAGIAEEAANDESHYTAELLSTHWGVFGAHDGLDPIDAIDALNR